MYIGAIRLGQININVSKEFQEDLAAFMEARGVKTKSDAIKLAIKEAAALAKAQLKTDFSSWLGAGNKTASSVESRFKSEDDLWKVG